MKINVNGIDINYEKTGEGRPLVMVHGNGEDHSIFDEAIALLKKKYTCYAVDSRNHGGSGSVPELHYDDMTNDMVAFMDALDLNDVIFYGFSDGGIIGLLLISSHPNCIGALAISGTNLSPDGLIPSFAEEYTAINRNQSDPLITLMLTEPHIDPEALRKIAVPVLVTAGENDLILRSETERIANLIPNSTLVILEGEDHGSYIVNSDIMGGLLIDFLDREWLE